ncbi:OmpA family protein [Adhaeribacter rhizoryzae]|uniref:OmpA family protein n=1 Tax=Adhaeribacter rhizoryzae TaxID=2607907 RepID=A0A5M6CUN1_9BACT|nr:OmpA family protein [Adhaeribacter rhizoryzae]KAA5538957.1 OmpA family protein [Adhaeribacter rhizoryzae]
MKCLLTIFLCLSGLVAMAQHNLYNWQLKGYTGTAHYYNPDKRTRDYFKLNNHLWYQLEMSRNLGNSFGLAVSGSFGKIRGLRPQGSSFVTEVRMNAARLYFYTDNGWLLKPSAFVSPYFFSGYGLSNFSINSTGASTEQKYRQVLPFGMGLKFRLTERWQLDLQTEAVYNLKPHLNATEGEQNKYNNSFLHTGLSLAYSFGFKPSSFKASRFYTSFQDPLNQASSARLTPVVSPVDSLVNSSSITLPDAELVGEQHKLESTDEIRSRRVAIQTSDANYSSNKSRTIIQQNPVRQDIPRTATGEKIIKEQETNETEFNTGRTQVASPTRETIRVTEQSIISEMPKTIADSTLEPTSNVYENDRFSQHTVKLIEKDRKELERADKENEQLEYTRDSLHNLSVQDTLQVKPINPSDSVFNALDDKTLRYRQQQATLNDSIRQRLAFYQNELTRLEASKSTKAAVKPNVKSNFDTNVFFKVNSYEVPSQSFNELLSLAAQLKANPEEKLQLTGYADQTGKPLDNFVLSRKRVEKVAAFFQGQGIAKERVLLQYFGEVNSEEALNSLNRKVVIKTID